MYAWLLELNGWNLSKLTQYLFKLYKLHKMQPRSIDKTNGFIFFSLLFIKLN